MGEGDPGPDEVTAQERAALCVLHILQVGCEVVGEPFSDEVGHWNPLCSELQSSAVKYLNPTECSRVGRLERDISVSTLTSFNFRHFLYPFWLALPLTCLF